MKKLIIAAVILFTCSNACSQFNLKLKEEKKPLQFDNSFSLAKNVSPPVKMKTAGVALPFMFYTLLFINPMLVIEDKKVYFGLTKEISFGYFPYGRFSFEYSYIIRDKNTSHLRFSYNYDFILEAGDFAAFTLTPGAGYFTDTKNKGWFAQASFGLFLPVFFSAVNPYIKYRHTFVQDKQNGKTDIDDISLGMGFLFYFNN